MVVITPGGGGMNGVKSVTQVPVYKTILTWPEVVRMELIGANSLYIVFDGASY